MVVFAREFWMEGPDIPIELHFVVAIPISLLSIKASLMPSKHRKPRPKAWHNQSEISGRVMNPMKQRMPAQRQP